MLMRNSLFSRANQTLLSFPTYLRMAVGLLLIFAANKFIFCRIAAFPMRMFFAFFLLAAQYLPLLVALL